MIFLHIYVLQIWLKNVKNNLQSILDNIEEENQNIFSNVSVGLSNLDVCPPQI